MTVSEFACAMYGCDIVKDRVKITYKGEIIYDDRMEFLRYAHEDDPKMWFTDKTIEGLSMLDMSGIKLNGYNPDYFTVIAIREED